MSIFERKYPNVVDYWHVYNMILDLYENVKSDDTISSAYNAGVGDALATVMFGLDDESAYRCKTCKHWRKYVDRSVADFGECLFGDYFHIENRNFFCANWSPIDDGKEK